MPPPGWYPDPEQAWTWRWWDGGRWTDLRSPQVTGPVGNPYSFSAWFQQSFELFKLLVRRVGLIILLAWCAVAVFGWLVTMLVFTSSKGREVRSLLEIDETFGPNGGSTTIVLTDAEADRLADLAGDILWGSLPWMFAFALLISLVWMWTTALSAIVGCRRDAAAADVSTITVDRSEAAGAAIRRVPAVFGALLVVAGVTLAVMVALLIPLIIAVAADAGGGVIALTAVFGFIAGVAVMSWLWVRLSLSIVLAAIGGHGIGVRRSWELTNGHFWGVAGRLIIAALIAGAVTTPLNFVNIFGFAMGFVVYLALIFLLQTLANVASVLISAPAQVVLIRHLTDRLATPLG